MSDYNRHTTPPVPRLRVFKDLDEPNPTKAYFVGEWYPTMEHGWQLRMWEDGFVDEDHARAYIADDQS